MDLFFCFFHINYIKIKIKFKLAVMISGCKEFNY